MAKISKDNNTLELRPYKLTDDGWTLSYLVLEKDGKKILETTGEFLQLSEYQSLLKHLKILLEGKSKELTLDTIEPNLLFKLKQADHVNYQLTISYDKKAINLSLHLSDIDTLVTQLSTDLDQFNSNSD